MVWFQFDIILLVALHLFHGPFSIGQLITWLLPIGLRGIVDIAQTAIGTTLGMYLFKHLNDTVDPSNR